MNNFLNFFPLKIKKTLNGHWNVPAIQQRSLGMNVHWKVTEQCLKSGFQWTIGHIEIFSWLRGGFSSCDISNCVWNLRFYTLSSQYIKLIHKPKSTNVYKHVYI